MIDLYYWPTPNGHKITMFLEEAGLPYKILPVNIGAGDQFKPEFLAISPNNRMPAIVDNEPKDGGAPISVFESGAILLYLAKKTGQFIPADLRGGVQVLEWLMWQMGGLGPMAGQNHHFAVYAPEKLPYAIDRYVKETNRLYGVLNKRLEDRPFVANEYSVADMACYPWIVPYERQGQKLEDFPHLKRWFEEIKARPATMRAYERAKEFVTPPVMSDKAKQVLFGQTSRSVQQPWQTKYPLPARQAMNRQARSLSVALLFFISAAGLFLGLSGHQIQMPIAWLADAQSAQPSTLTIEFRLLALFFCGCVGGATFSINSLVHSAARGRWRFGRRFGQFVFPIVGGVYASVLLTLIDAGFYRGGNSLPPANASAYAFFIGFFAYSISGMLAKIAQAMFGTPWKN